MYQFQTGGSIIGFQVENEFASLGVYDTEYLTFLHDLFIKHNITELLYTADAARYLKRGEISGVLQTANIGGNPASTLVDLAILKSLHPHQPLMTMESYTGWFDHWTDHHKDNTMNKTDYGKILTNILEASSSVNMYMFVGELFSVLKGSGSTNKKMNADS